MIVEQISEDGEMVNLKITFENGEQEELSRRAKKKGISEEEYLKKVLGGEIKKIK